MTARLLPLLSFTLATSLWAADPDAATTDSPAMGPPGGKVDQTAVQGLDTGKPFPLPGVDISGDASRQVVVAAGSPTEYEGHPTTLLLPDGKTILCVWNIGHGGTAGPLKRSEDGGKTWSELIPTPANWPQAKNCPTIYRVPDPGTGKYRLLVFTGTGPGAQMQMAHSEDEGVTWSPMAPLGIKSVNSFTTVVPVDGGKRLLGMGSIRRSADPADRWSNILAQSFSTDGGLTWGAWEKIIDAPDLMPCEPAVIRSPDGKQLLCFVRENAKRQSLFITSDDEGKTWSAPKPLPIGLVGDRHMPKYAPDGRLVVCFRDRAIQSGMFRHFVAWVGRYEDIVNGKEGEYRIKLLHSYKGTDCGYPGLEILPDGTFVATTYIKYRPGGDNPSIVSTRFKLSETDKMPKALPTPTPVPPAK